jgi:hypothetical protein
MARPKSGGTSARVTAQKASGKPRALPAADIERIVPLSGGRFAYVYLPDGTTCHAATNSPEFLNAVKATTKMGYGDRLRVQIENLAVTQPTSSWPAVSAMLAEAEAYTS